MTRTAHRRCQNPACRRPVPPSSDPLGRGHPRKWCDNRCAYRGKQLLDAIRAGTNDECARCGGEPLAGGLWCLPCWKAETADGLAPQLRKTCGTQAGYLAHAQHAERACVDCTTAASATARRWLASRKEAS